MTQNLWLAPHRRNTRLEAFVRLLREEGMPDVVCMQELTVDTIAMLMAHSIVRENYCISTTVEEFKVGTMVGTN